jgi:CheY-like chemotaxis protein/HPt (histidine-containing phosphotransfer) domain-containing protein
MGGTLCVTSAPGAGSRFTALIPFGISAGTTGHALVADLVGVRALIVDDNLTNQRVLLDMVAAWGCNAGVAEGAKEALVMLRGAVDDGRPFDVLLLDANMPDIDGYAFARMVSDDPRLADTPMVMLTSSAQHGETDRTQQAGIVAYLTKPVRSARLRSAVNVALGSTVATDPSGSPRRGSDPRHRATAPSNDVHHLSANAEDASARDSDHDRACERAGADCVLVVEDHLVNQKVLTAMLAKLGYRAAVAVNGFEALEAVRRNDYAAVLMDCQMPEMDGYETVERLRRSEGHDRHTFVIAVTATAMTGDRDRCLAAGMDDYLAKPVSVKSLEAVLARWAPRQADHTTAAPPLDPEIVERLRRLGVDVGEDLIGQLSTLFLADADVHVSELRHALASDDGAGMVRSAHTLRGASATLGAGALASLCATLEADSAAGHLVAAGMQLDALDTELGRVRSALSSFTLRP